MSMDYRPAASWKRSRPVVKKIDPKFLRIVDANFNRAKEGLRVCEDVCRFLLNDAVATKAWKQARHELTALISRIGLKEVMTGRDVDGDAGRGSTKSESRRTNPTDIFYANCQRVKESLRVLEEFAKLQDVKTAEGLKKLRYDIYRIEKKTLIS